MFSNQERLAEAKRNVILVEMKINFNHETLKS